jgi:uncharacterized membrane protein YkoI
MNKTRISLGSLAVITAFSFSTVAFAAPTDEAALMKEAKVSKADAEKTALAKVPKGTIKSEEIEREHGKLVWSFDIAKPGTKDITEIQVDAISGKIAHTEIEKPKDQAREAAGEKVEKK